MSSPAKTAAMVPIVAVVLKDSFVEYRIAQSVRNESCAPTVVNDEGQSLPSISLPILKLSHICTVKVELFFFQRSGFLLYSALQLQLIRGQHDGCVFLLR